MKKNYVEWENPYNVFVFILSTGTEQAKHFVEVTVGLTGQDNFVKVPNKGKRYFVRNYWCYTKKTELNLEMWQNTPIFQDSWHF
jgi:hypothetical protein